MRIITEPTVVLSDEVETLRKIGIDSPEFPDALQGLMQEAFVAGAEHGQVIKPAVQPVLPAINVEKKPVLPYRDNWAEIDETGPENPVEVFIFNDMPNPDAEGVNHEGWLARFRDALKYVSK